MMEQTIAADQRTADAAPGAFYAAGAEGLRALKPATGPWDPRWQSGVALSGLLAHLLEDDPGSGGMDIARYQLDILRPAPFDTPMQTERTVVREGGRLRITDIALISGGTCVARASALRLRLSETPDLAETPPPSPPEDVTAPPMSRRRSLERLLESKLMSGGLEEPGPGESWFRFTGDIVEGKPISPFVAAAMISDFASGVSSVFDWRAYTFANVDISLNLARAPRDGWIHVAAETITHGGGRALVNATLSDRFGPFARAHQTLFIDPRN